MHTKISGMKVRPVGLRGFSLLELLVVAAVGAVVFTSAALAFRVVAKNQRAVGLFQEVALPTGVGSNFYPGSTLTVVDSYTAPNFGRCSQADVMRTLFLEDVAKSVAVFVLPRVGNINTIRSRTLDLRGKMPWSLDTPEVFLSYLLNNPDTATAAQVFTTYRGAPPATATTTTSTVNPSTGVTTTTTTTGYVTNATVFLLQPSGLNTQLWIRSVWEIDYVNMPADGSVATSPDVPCVFGTVRRYVDNTLTNYYDVVFRDAAMADAGIPAAHFERDARGVYTETAVDKYKKAGAQPFYLLWWPDPGLSRLKGTSAGTYGATAPQAAYAAHEGQTSYFFVVPQFPAL